MPGLLDTESTHIHTHYLLGIQPQGGSEDKAKTGGEWAEQLCGSHGNEWLLRLTRV